MLAGDANETRLAAAGRTDALRETSLRGDEFARAAERVERAAQRAHARGVTAAFHPHVGTYIESPEEIAALLEATDPDVVSICFDTGHTVVGGGDPIEFAVTARDRIAHLHLKDVEPRILERLRSRELTVEQAWEHGLFCRLGDGVVDFDAVLTTLDDYSGWAVVEQDRIVVRALDLEAVREIEAHNLTVAGRTSACRRSALTRGAAPRNSSRVEPPRGTVTALLTDTETPLLRELGTDRVETLLAS